MIETIKDAARAVWNELGYGYREDVYEKAMAHEMRTNYPDVGFTVEAHAETYVIMDATVSNFGEQTATKIRVVSELSNLISPGEACSEFYRIVMHEAGHAFGLDDPPTDSVAESATDVRYITCTPTKYDVVAIKAIYQSRP